jgi:hypothetical protein
LKHLSLEKCAIDVEVGTRGVAMAAGFQEISLLRNTNPRKLKWRLPETEMLVRAAKMLQQLLGLKELPKKPR